MAENFDYIFLADKSAEDMSDLSSELSSDSSLSDALQPIKPKPSAWSAFFNIRDNNNSPTDKENKPKSSLEFNIKFKF